MKHLRLIDHNGVVTLEQQVFVDGVDWEYEFKEPVALWFGKVELVDKLFKVVGEVESVELQEVVKEKEEKEVQAFETEAVSTESGGNARLAPSGELEGVEVSPEDRNDRDAPGRSKRDKRASSS